jgi:integrase
MPKKAKTKYDGIYQRPDAEGYWGSWTAADGRRVRRRFQVSTLEQARRALAAEKLKVEEHIKFGKPLLSEESFSAFATDFLKHQERRIASQVTRGKISAAEYERQRGIIENHLKPCFGEMRLASIRRKDVKTFIDSRTGNVSDGTIIKECNVLKRMFNYAVELEKIAANPAYRAQLPQAPEGRCRYLTPTELSKVLKACPSWLQPIAGLALALGTRRGELLAVRWEDIDSKAGTVLLRQTKNGKKRPAFINELAAQVLASMSAGKPKGRRTGLLFPDVTPANVTVTFVRMCKSVGIEDFSFHDLRHTYASHLRMRGADLHDLQKLLGHSDPRMTNRYAHLSNEHLGNAARRLDGAFSLALPSAEAAVTADHN